MARVKGISCGSYALFDSDQTRPYSQECHSWTKEPSRGVKLVSIVILSDPFFTQQRQQPLRRMLKSSNCMHMHVSDAKRENRVIKARISTVKVKLILFCYVGLGKQSGANLIYCHHMVAPWISNGTCGNVFPFEWVCFWFCFFFLIAFWIH